METITGLTELVETTLSDFIKETLQKKETQILNTRQWFKDHKGKQVDPANKIVNHSWIYIHKRVWAGQVEYSKFYSLTKAGDRKYSEVMGNMEKQLSRFKTAMLTKIVAALVKYNATEFIPLSVRFGPLGIEGIYEIGNGRKVQFSAIMAGGWNIQCLHYRYTVKAL